MSTFSDSASSPSPSDSQGMQRQKILRAIKLGVALEITAARHAAHVKRLLFSQISLRQALGHLDVKLVYQPYERGGDILAFALLHHLRPDEPVPLWLPGPLLASLAKRQRLDPDAALAQVMWCTDEGVYVN